MHNPVPVSDEQKRTFREDGFMKLEQCLSGELLERLRVSVDSICSKTEQFVDLVQNEAANGAMYVCGIDHLLLKDEPVFLELLGSPMLLSIAQAVCGGDFFPVQEFVVIKKLGDPSIIDWHQDVVSHSIGTTCMVGLYLDPANEQNGALNIVPGSQHLGTAICQLKQLSSTCVSMQAGDILAHDLMVAHCSGPLTEFPQRRVVYFEFMNTKRALSDKVYSEQFIEARKQLLPLANAFFNAAHSELSDVQMDSVLQNVSAIHEHVRDIKPANYCFDFR